MDVEELILGVLGHECVPPSYVATLLRMDRRSIALAMNRMWKKGLIERYRKRLGVNEWLYRLRD